MRQNLKILTSIEYFKMQFVEIQPIFGISMTVFIIREYTLKEINMETRIVFKISVARQLLKLGYSIIDLKPQKKKDGNLDFTRCYFVFKYIDGLDDDIKSLINK